MKNIKFLLVSLLSISLIACSPDTTNEMNIDPINEGNVQDSLVDKQENSVNTHENSVNTHESKPNEDSQSQGENSSEDSNTSKITEEPDTNYKLIKVDGGDTSGYRESNVVVNIGHGDREYWAYTNEHGQLIRVTAKEIVVQDDEKEDVNADGRYYSRMADVPGVGADYGMDRGHVIADSLGGVANAYNITPQEATLNRHGDQAYMERNIRQAGGASNFEAIITYPNTETQTPSKYKYTYTIMGNVIVDEFENKNPDKVNEKLGLTKPKEEKANPKDNSSKPASENPADKSSGDLNAQNPGNVKMGDVDSVDVNSNGKVTVQEAKDAGFKMPIYRGHWLYEYMDDRNDDGKVG